MVVDFFSVLMGNLFCTETKKQKMYRNNDTCPHPQLSCTPAPQGARGRSLEGIGIEMNSVEMNSKLCLPFTS